MFERHRSSRLVHRTLLAVPLLCASACAGDVTAVEDAVEEARAPEHRGWRGRTYENPIQIRVPGTGRTVENCPDPSIIRGQQPGDRSTRACTS